MVYFIVNCRCTVLYIAETERRRQERFSEHLRSIRNHHSSCFPVAEHFNSASHTIENIMVCEQGTLRPKGLNVNFSFIRLRFHARIELAISIVDFRKLIKWVLARWERMLMIGGGIARILTLFSSRSNS